MLSSTRLSLRSLATKAKVEYSTLGLDASTPPHHTDVSDCSHQVNPELLHQLQVFRDNV